MMKIWWTWTTTTAMNSSQTKKTTAKTLSSSGTPCSAKRRLSWCSGNHPLAIFISHMPPARSTLIGSLRRILSLWSLELLVGSFSTSTKHIWIFTISTRWASIMLCSRPLLTKRLSTWLRRATRTAHGLGRTAFTMSVTTFSISQKAPSISFLWIGASRIPRQSNLKSMIPKVLSTSGIPQWVLRRK